MLLTDGIISIIAIIVFSFVFYLEKDNLTEWQKSVQGKPISWTERGQRVNRR